MKKKRLEFSDKQKAQIFVLDRAICAFSGKSLWLLDYHLCPTYDIDWVDHIKPAMNGGGNDIENGVCASSFFNAKKKDNSHDNLYFFFRGKPTEDFFYFYEFLPKTIASNLERFQNLHWTDWEMNRAFFMFMLALDYRVDPYLKNGKKQIRDDFYYSKACLKRVLAWQKHSKAEDVSSLTERKILSADPSPEQLLLISVLEAKTVEDVLTKLDKAFIFYSRNCEIFQSFLDGETISGVKLAEASEHMQEVVGQDTIGLLPM